MKLSEKILTPIYFGIIAFFVAAIDCAIGSFLIDPAPVPVLAIATAFGILGVLSGLTMARLGRAVVL
jgi:hypothetical protein